MDTWHAFEVLIGCIFSLRSFKTVLTLFIHSILSPGKGKGKGKGGKKGDKGKAKDKDTSDSHARGLSGSSASAVAPKSMPKVSPGETAVDLEPDESDKRRLESEKLSRLLL